MKCFQEVRQASQPTIENSYFQSDPSNSVFLYRDILPKLITKPHHLSLPISQKTFAVKLVVH